MSKRFMSVWKFSIQFLCLKIFCTILLLIQIRTFKLNYQMGNSYSGQVFWGKHQSQCSRKCQFRTTKSGKSECGGQHEMLLDLLHQKFSSSSLPGILRVCLDRTYFAETENWKHCNKIIFKYVNSNVGLNFNEKVTQKWNLWIPCTVHGTTKLIKKLKSQQLPATVHMNSSRCPWVRSSRKKKKGEKT